jgi:hypothetical protein
VSFDPEHLRRVLVNLLDNAHRHASDEPGAIFLRLAGQGRWPRQPGGAQRRRAHRAEVERHLFEPFFSTRSRGSGLGLYICRELCERYGASIEYRPRPAAERLRNEFRGHDAARHAVGPRRAAAGTRLSPGALREPPLRPRLLVVDDEPDLRTLYELTLLREGYDVDSAGGVEEAWALLQARPAATSSSSPTCACPTAAGWTCCAASTKAAAARRPSSSPPTARPRTRWRR